MKTAAQKAFTLLELLVVISIIMILASMVMVAMSSARAKSRQSACLNNLHQLGLGFTGFVLDHEGKYPMDVSERLGGSLEYVQSRLITNTPFSRDFRHFAALSNEVPNVKIMTCPADRPRRPASDYRSFTNINLSYWANTKATPHATLSMLSGDWNLRAPGFISNEFAQLDFGRRVHHLKGSVLFADGRVEITRSFAFQPTVPADPIAVAGGAPTPTPAATPTAAPNVRRPTDPAPPTVAADSPVTRDERGVGSSRSVAAEKKPDQAELAPTNQVATQVSARSEGLYGRSSRVTPRPSVSDPLPGGPDISLAPRSSVGNGPQPSSDDSEPWDTPGFRLFKALAIVSYLFSLLLAIIALLLLYLRSRMAQRQQERASAIKMD